MFKMYIFQQDGDRWLVIWSYKRLCTILVTYAAVLPKTCEHTRMWKIGGVTL